LDNPSIAHLVNGNLNKFFRLLKGLRQGCPLSPFLYIIFAELLGRRIEEKDIIGLIWGGVKGTGAYSIKRGYQLLRGEHPTLPN